MAAVFDGARDVLVISVVYDGPPEAGKTSSLAALAKSLGRTLYTPEALDGRTTYFDWMEYTGGRFDGSEIRCQVVTVPGQTIWAERRRALLEQAEVVVFVGDTSLSGWPGTLEQLSNLRRQLDQRSGPPVGVVFQANKRDLKEVVPLASIREQLEVLGWRIGVVESSAEEGWGTREAFVFAVRLALDRVRELQKRGELPKGSSTFETGEALFAHLKTFIEAPKEPVFLSERGSPAPRAPSADVPSGLIWPPVEGRIILHEATEGLSTVVTSKGDCLAVASKPWRVHSRAAASFSGVEEGRAALISWARFHAVHQTAISRRRCIILVAEDSAPESPWRLWQIMHAERSLADILIESFAASTFAAAERIADCARLLINAQQRLALPCTLYTIGQNELGDPMYVGLMPAIDERPLPPCDAYAVATELTQLIQRRARDRSREVAGALKNLPPSRAAFDGGREIFDRLIHELER